ncbi:hypothetical protein [Gordonia aurantiaca]|uniref:hypothetical protein n=1 Tax=Gordonia sp. B21 TaxID=3151852 RepID=UPI003265ACC8
MFVRWSGVGLLLGLVTIGIWYATRSPDVVLVARGESGDSLGLNLVIEPLLLAIPVVFALGYGLVAALLAARKPRAWDLLGFTRCVGHSGRELPLGSTATL